MTTEADFVAASVDPRIGMMVQDKYRLIRKLGEGGMGAVYEGEHVLIRKRVALKFLHPQFASSGEVVGRFYREATAATSIGNEHIIEVTDLGRLPDGSVFMVLEFLDGQSLGTLMEHTGPMPLGRIARIAMQMCDALGAAHAKGIVHRDLKPDNVFLITRSGDPDFVKVLDFGIAKVLDASDGLGVATRTNAAMGTPYYMAPEQCRGAKDVDARTDLYALGIILHKALAGSYPFMADAFPALVLQICTQAPTGLRFFRPDVPEAFEALVLRLLAKERTERFPDASSLRAALAPFADFDRVSQLPNSPQGGLPALASAPSSPIASVPPWITSTGSGASTTEASLERIGVGTKSYRGVAAGIAFVLVAVLVGGVAMMRGRHPPPVQAREIVPPAVPGTAEHPASHVEAVVAPASGPDPAIASADPFAVTPGARVRVQIMTAPADAQLFLNARHIANPFDAELPQSTVVHRLEARRDGFTTVVQDLVLEFPQTVRVRMTHGDGVQDLRRPTAPASRGGHVVIPSGATPPTALPTANPAAEPHTPVASPSRTPATAPPDPPVAPRAPDTPPTGVPPPQQGVRSPF